MLNVHKKFDLHLAYKPFIYDGLAVVKLFFILAEVIIDVNVF